LKVAREIGFNRGSVPEIIEHGVTGFVVDCVEEAAEAAQLARSLDRANVRKAFERRFSAEMMAQAYKTARYCGPLCSRQIERTLQT